MKVLVQTRLTPILTIYDTEAQSAGGGSLSYNAVRTVLKPVIAVTTDDGSVLYKTENFYPSYYSYLPYIGIAIAAYFVYRRLF